MAKGKKPIEQYDHKGKTRINNPPVGLVAPETDKDTAKMAIKVINHYGDEVLKVYEVWESEDYRRSHGGSAVTSC